MSNQGSSIFHNLYMDIVETMEHLCATRRSLASYEYISENENSVLLNAIHILCQEMVMLGKNIKMYEEAETVFCVVPEL